MDQAQSVDGIEPASRRTDIDIQFSKWFEMMQAYGSSDDTAETTETPASPPEAVALEEPKTESDPL